MCLSAWLMLDHYRIHIPAPRRSDIMVSRTGNFLFSRCHRRCPNPLVKIQLHSHIYLPGRLENTSSRVTICPIKTGEGENKFGKTMSSAPPHRTSPHFCSLVLRTDWGRRVLVPERADQDLGSRGCGQDVKGMD